jgi:hypothetical protein
MRDIAQACAEGARLAPACALAGIAARTLQRWKINGLTRGDRRPDADRPVPSHALSEAERARIIEVANEPRFAATPPVRIIPALADEGLYIASEVWLMEGALEVFAPDHDWQWIRKVSRRLGVRARRHKPESRPIVHGPVLHNLARQVMRESWSPEEDINPSLYRAGLAVALLAAAPMRIANLAALELGRQLRREGRYWTIYLTADETKTREADVWPISSQLCACIDQYLSVVRPALCERASNTADTAVYGSATAAIRSVIRSSARSSRH